VSQRYEVKDRLLSEDGRAIEVHWGDGHTSIYPFQFLRGYCPCATCQGHARSALRWQDADEVDLVGVRLVGNYGISPQWSDGHETGIFADQNLRRICPCPECLDWQGGTEPIQPLTD
jgi:DUF971 family protein